IIWLGDTPVGVIAGADPTQMVSASNAATLYYVHTDQLNTPRLITDTAGNVRWKWPVTGEPFGNTSPSETPTSGQTAFTFNLRFPGQYADSETGTFYNYFRTYNPQTGRYLQSDPIGLDGGFNTYAYVGGDPIRFTDEMGLSASGSSQGGSPQRKCDGDKCTEDPATDVSCFAQCSDGASCQQCCHKQANKLAQSGTNPEAIGIRFILECTKSCILKDAPPQQGSPSNPPDKPWICKLLPWKCRASGKAGK
ncbi:RHS repeat domain-containing protein, partial [Aquabacterium sp.]|uniref:RHS repeat domain-containing protein n=1 Tax=Aquabacterium sp. TaxID=1872578 RepID=UPI0035B0F7BB